MMDSEKIPSGNNTDKENDGRKLLFCISLIETTKALVQGININLNDFRNEPPHDKKEQNGMCAQQRLRSTWADAQSDLSLRWAYMPFRWFCHEAAQMKPTFYWIFWCMNPRKFSHK